MLEGLELEMLVGNIWQHSGTCLGCCDTPLQREGLTAAGTRGTSVPICHRCKQVPFLRAMHGAARRQTATLTLTLQVTPHISFVPG